jgi:MFS family permease
VVTVAETNILAALSSTELDRGRVFGLLAVTSGLGQLIGGALFAFAVAGWGYSGVFVTAALVGIVWILPVCFLRNPILPRAPARRNSSAATGLDIPTLLIIVSAALAGAIVVGARLGSWIIMDQRGLGAAAVASTVAVGGAVSMPVTLLLAWLSDRMSRRLLLAGSYVLAMAGLAILAPASALWQFLILSSIISITNSAAFLANALIADVTAKERLGVSVSLLGSAQQIARTISGSVTGVAIASFGASWFVTMGLVVASAAVALMVPPRRAREPSVAAPLS